MRVLTRPAVHGPILSSSEPEPPRPLGRPQPAVGGSGGEGEGTGDAPPVAAPRPGPAPGPRSSAEVPAPRVPRGHLGVRPAKLPRCGVSLRLPAELFGGVSPPLVGGLRRRRPPRRLRPRPEPGPRRDQEVGARRGARTLGRRTPPRRTTVVHAPGKRRLTDCRLTPLADRTKRSTKQ